MSDKILKADFEKIDFLDAIRWHQAQQQYKDTKEKWFEKSNMIHMHVYSALK